MLNLTRRTALLTTAALACAHSVSAANDDWPSRPIRLVVPFPPGGGSDNLTRLIAARLTAQKGWTIVVDNKPGAGGNLGLDFVAKSRPDGYTLGMGQTANLAINPTLYTNLPFNAAKDFIPIAMVASQPLIFVVRSDSPLHTLANLISTALKKPGRMTMASAGSGTAGHLVGESLARAANARFSHVPYKGFGQAMNDLLGGQVDFLVTSPQSCISQLRSGKVRALAVSATRRLKILPEVPTIMEAGFEGIDGADWKVVIGPAGLPNNIVQRVHTEVQLALSAPDTVARLESEGAEPVRESTAAARAFILSEQKRWGTIVRDSGATLD